LADNFHQGVIGIVASQLVNKYNLPVILFTYGSPINGRAVLKGSGRSVSDVNLIEIIKQCGRFLLKFGGHAMAAGMSLFEENFNYFKTRFSEVLADTLFKKQKDEQFIIDAKFPIDKLFENGIVEQLQRLEPFGIGNRKPIFSDSTPLINDCHAIGHNGDHLKVVFRGKYSNRKGIGFNLGNRRELLETQRSNQIIYTPALNRFKNTASWEVRLLDIL